MNDPFIPDIAMDKTKQRSGGAGEKTLTSFA
jgi:hypothetical protein